MLLVDPQFHPKYCDFSGAEITGGVCVVRSDRHQTLMGEVSEPRYSVDVD